MRTAEKLTSLSLLLIGIVFLLMAIGMMKMSMVIWEMRYLDPLALLFLAFSILVFVTGLISLLAGGANLIHRK
jgi:uncharacterized membrane protein YidH (DUF202 family)